MASDGLSGGRAKVVTKVCKEFGVGVGVATLNLGNGLGNEEQRTKNAACVASLSEPCHRAGPESDAGEETHSALTNSSKSEIVGDFESVEPS